MLSGNRGSKYNHLWGPTSRLVPKHLDVGIVPDAIVSFQAEPTRELDSVF